MISLVGHNSAAGANTITIPAHQSGDLMVIFAYRRNASGEITLPSGWTDLINVNGSGTQACRCGYRVATSNSETSGTWTNAQAMLVHVFRGQDTVGASNSTTGSGTTVTFPALTMHVASGTSWVLGFAGHRAGNFSGAPSGMTLRENFGSEGNYNAMCADTNGGVSSWSAQTTTVSSTGNWIGATIEIKSAAAGSSFFSRRFPRGLGRGLRRAG
jgi:hypothetical protein